MCAVPSDLLERATLDRLSVLTAHGGFHLAVLGVGIDRRSMVNNKQSITLRRFLSESARTSRTRLWQRVWFI